MTVRGMHTQALLVALDRGVRDGSPSQYEMSRGLRVRGRHPDGKRRTREGLRCPGDVPQSRAGRV